MKKWGIITVEVTSANIASFLTAANRLNAGLSNVKYLDELRISACVPKGDFQKILNLAISKGDDLKVTAQTGVFFTGKKILKRPVLIIGALVWLFLTLYLPSRVLFMQVDGNKQIHTVQILEAAEKCGITFGASRRHVRSEKVKNALLSEIPMLEWAGINTYGCVAVISVRERSQPLETKRSAPVSSIVASHDGIITEMTVTKGNSLCRPGQAVRKGQVLVSGYTDCGLTIKAEQAQAEITALTRRRISAITPTFLSTRKENTQNNARYSIQIGKNIIKLYKDSGISDAGCVKMYSQHFLTLPGGFALPVSLIKETVSSYICVEEPAEDDWCWVDEHVEQYLQSNMVAGRILNKSAAGNIQSDRYCFDGIYTCEEMIGRIRLEEKLEDHGKGIS